MRFITGLAIGWFTLNAEGTMRQPLRPPSSLEPQNASASIRAHHTHRAVLACESRAQLREPRCEPTFEKRDATTTFRLDPVKLSRITRRDDTREPVAVRVRSDGTAEGDRVRVAPGVWEVVWQGLPARKRFSAEPGAVVDVALETQTGRCERVVGQCLIRNDAITRRAEVTVR